jgi:hypothetical protein
METIVIRTRFDEGTESAEVATSDKLCATLPASVIINYSFPHQSVLPYLYC